MSLSPSRWHKVSESEFPWERDALQYLADHLPDRDPVRLWSNFEFVSADGHLNEVDALILTGKGLFLVEIKSRPARRLVGDAYTWTWLEGSRSIESDNPVALADRKAKRLASLLAREERKDNVRLPFIETLVFCSAAGLDITLPANLAVRVFGRDRLRDDGAVALSGIVEALTSPLVGPRASERAIDTALARTLTRHLDRAGVCRARGARRVNGYKLGERLADGPLYQDYVATHPALARQASARFDNAQEMCAAADQGRFLVITEPPRYLARAAHELVRQYGVRPWSVEAGLLRSMKETAAVGRVAWDVTIRAAAAPRDGQPWRNIQALVRRAMASVPGSCPGPPHPSS